MWKTEIIMRKMCGSFFSLRFFCVFTQAIIVKINENDGKYEKKYMHNTPYSMIFP